MEMLSDWMLTMLISIHALREEGDRGWTGSGRAHEHFYPRPP